MSEELEDAIDRSARSLQALAEAFNSKPGAIPFTDEHGNVMGDITKGVIGIAQAANRIADAIRAVSLSLDDIASCMSAGSGKS